MWSRHEPSVRNAQDGTCAEGRNQGKWDEVADAGLARVYLEDTDLPAPVVRVLSPQSSQG